MMLWLVLLLVLCSFALFFAAGGMTLHVLRQRRQARQAVEEAAAVEASEGN